MALNLYKLPTMSTAVPVNLDSMHWPGCLCIYNSVVNPKGISFFSPHVRFVVCKAKHLPRKSRLFFLEISILAAKFIRITASSKQKSRVQMIQAEGQIVFEINYEPQYFIGKNSANENTDHSRKTMLLEDYSLTMIADHFRSFIHHCIVSCIAFEAFKTRSLFSQFKYKSHLLVEKISQLFPVPRTHSVRRGHSVLKINFLAVAIFVKKLRKFSTKPLPNFFLDFSRFGLSIKNWKLDFNCPPLHPPPPP